MDGFADYCAARSALEESRLRLVGKLATLTTKLMELIGQNHGAFLASKAECEQTRDELAEVHRQIRNHRLEHRC